MSVGLLPIADLYKGNWTDQSGSTDSLFDNMNERGGLYIRSETGPPHSAVVFRLTPGVLASDPRSFRLSMRCRKDAPGAALSLVAELWSEYVSEDDKGVLMNTVVVSSDVPDDWLPVTSQLDLLTDTLDYDELSVRIVVHSLTGGTQAALRRASVSLSRPWLYKSVNADNFVDASDRAHIGWGYTVSSADEKRRIYVQLVRYDVLTKSIFKSAFGGGVVGGWWNV